MSGCAARAGFPDREPALPPTARYIGISASIQARAERLFRAIDREDMIADPRFRTHPSQVPILNEEFRPSADQVDHARRVVAAYDKALAEGVGAVTVDGKMIDVPVIERARLLVERAAAIATREARIQSLG
jgi:hypothetical protein